MSRHRAAGSEIKSIRAGHVNLKDAYAKVEKGEMWLLNCHIASYSAGVTMTMSPPGPQTVAAPEGTG
jgi:SsrA-binding protein